MRLSVAVFVGGMILACAGGKDAGKDEEEGQDSSSENPDDTIPQAEACADYLDCLAAVDPALLASVQSTYGTEGTCWSDEASAAQCAEACATGLAQMDDEYPEEPACDDGVVTEAGDLEGRWNFERESTDRGCEAFVLTFDTMNLDISADGATDFTADGRAEVGIVGNWYDFDLELTCSLSGDEFSCDEYVGDFDSHWIFEGVYRGSGINGTVEIGLGDGEGRLQCAEVIVVIGDTY